MIHFDSNNFPYFESLNEAKSEGYTVIPVKSAIQFFTLAGRKSVMTKENLVPIENLKYLLKETVPQEMYYIKDYRGYSLNELFFYRRDLNFSGDDLSIERFRDRIADGNVWLILTTDQVEDMKVLLKRIWKSQLTGEGSVPYKIFIDLLENSIKLQDYLEYSEGLTGRKTVEKQFKDNIAALWKQASTKALKQ